AVPRVFEKVFNTAQQQVSESKARSRIFRAAVETAIAWSKSRAAAGPDGAGQVLRLRHALFDRLGYAKPRAAVGRRAAVAVAGGAGGGAPRGGRRGHFSGGPGIPTRGG